MKIVLQLVTAVVLSVLNWVKTQADSKWSMGQSVVALLLCSALFASIFILTIKVLESGILYG